ncbi:UNVERIFIED_CONTAM: hypothetical protein Sangu_2193500 [Sesamum angustifolium]|uniref:Uncharacterized protein n=1 Tax=Sesamum angustifolium TaxID=2727405 RepID=A0AAW2LEK3_9LAMI
MVDFSHIRVIQTQFLLESIQALRSSLEDENMHASRALPGLHGIPCPVGHPVSDNNLKLGPPAFSNAAYRQHLPEHQTGEALAEKSPLRRAWSRLCLAPGMYCASTPGKLRCLLN